MKAVAIEQYLPINHPQALLDVELPQPQAQGRDLLVKVEAIAVNPVDAKVRGQQGEVENPPRVLGWDAAGTVVAVGPEVALFKVGDPVYYAGSITRQGANSEYHLVDERIVGHKPASLSFTDAAALPLTTITAWEGLFERLRIARDGSARGQRLLVVAGAGGVGSMAIQLAAKVAGLEVIATASRPASADWCRKMGASHVIDHNGDMPAQLRALGIEHVEHILCAADIDPHFDALAEMIAPQGLICTIVAPLAPLPIGKLMQKSAGLVWELMFTRSMFNTSDMQQQHALLNETARLVDAGVLQTTVGEHYGQINAANLRRAHATLEGKHMQGKIVLSGY